MEESISLELPTQLRDLYNNYWSCANYKKVIDNEK